ncbi:MAG: DUF5123 domain-containing protein [Bacteroidetes bacterium]|nr:DUF5123 domain-containing protein [Bacteroidota bacterium]
MISYVKYFKKMTFFVLLCFTPNLIQAQTVHQVTAGTDVLIAAVTAAASGDIIELTTSGGLYLSTDQIEVDKDLIFRGVPGLAEKPILKYTGTSTSAYFFKVIASPKVRFENLEFDGDGVADGAAAKAKYVLRLDNADPTGTMDVRMNNCVSHDFADKFIKPYGNCGIDSLFIHNSVFYNGASEGIVLYSGSSSDPAVALDYAEIVNCTFYGITREAIKADTNPDTKILVDNCTIYNSGGTAKGMLYVDDLLNVEIKNSIFVENGFVDNFVRLESDANSFHHNVVYNVASWDVDNSVTVSDTLHANPKFADAANADFTLAQDSPALTAGVGGTVAGDLRWDPNFFLPKVHKVEAGIDVLLAAIAAAAPGDTVEFSTSGGVYLSADQIELNKDLFFRARPGLAEKPILKYIGTSTSAYIFKVDGTAKLSFVGIEFDGDGVADGAAGKAKYALRIDTGDTLSAIEIRIEDCVMHDFADKMIKPYGNTGIDSLIVHNTTFYNGASEGVVLYSGSSSDPAVRLKYAEFYNCTFYNIAREGLKADTNPSTKLLVNQCTFYNNGSTSKGHLYVDDLLDVEIKNSIFVKNTYVENFVRLESDANSFHHNVVFDVASWDVDNSATISDTLHADPKFADAANADFTLGADSPARTAGEGGLPVGDLRWAIDLNKKIVTVLTEGKGIVNLDPVGGIYDPGTQVQFTAVPDANWEFEMWEGLNVFPPNLNPATVTVDDHMTVTAKFKNLSPQVSLTIDTVGLGYVTANPEAGDDGTYDKGETVTLTATGRPNWTFVEWLGDVIGTENPITFNVDSNMTVQASFASTLTQFTLTVNIVGNGEVLADPKPIIATYDTNTVVTLTAVPATGWEFGSWTGALTTTVLVDSLVMDGNHVVTATFIEKQVAGGVLEIDDSWDLYDAVSFANNNSTVHTLELTTSGGLYTSRKPETVYITKPLTIRAKAGLEAKPILTNSDPSTTGASIDILRVFDDFVLEGVVMDGGHAESHGMKYGVRMSHTTGDSVKVGANVTLRNVDFKDMFDGKSLTADGHAFKVDVYVRAGVIKIENCTFTNTGYEAIRMSDTEKWPTDKICDSLIVRNCTFTNIDAEGIRYYSDLNPLTPDAPLVIEHLTFNNSGTRTMYLKNSGGAVVRDIVIANTRQSGHGRDSDLMDSQGNTDAPSYVSHIVTFNTPDGVVLKAADGLIDEETVWAFDPKFEDTANMNYTLLAESHMYGLASDGEAIGDLRWATNTPTHVSLEVVVDGNGEVTVDPAPVGKTYDKDQEVTLTAVADTGYIFTDWSGDLTSTINPVNVVLDVSKTITAKFDIDTYVDELGIPTVFALEQNFPNPFNPSTTIKYALPVDANVSVRIYNVLGQEVITLIRNVEFAAGYQNVVWNGTNNNGENVSTGIYIYRIEAKGIDGKDFVKSMKMMFLK